MNPDELADARVPGTEADETPDARTVTTPAPGWPDWPPAPGGDDESTDRRSGFEPTPWTRDLDAAPVPARPDRAESRSGVGPGTVLAAALGAAILASG
ncbi:MAG TPA: hypothetical protein VEY67_10780, partial [Candidatus Dormibacteraeota bacterium]|nr:hypothetical protein [Candidatus Dormibacteraeota bacterium]